MANSCQINLRNPSYATGPQQHPLPREDQGAPDQEAAEKADDSDEEGEVHGVGDGLEQVEMARGRDISMIDMEIDALAESDDSFVTVVHVPIRPPPSPNPLILEGKRKRRKVMVVRMNPKRKAYKSPETK